MKKNIRIKQIAQTLLFQMFFMNFVLFSVPPAPTLAQTTTQTTVRLTLPLGSNANLVVQKVNGVESQIALISDSLASTKVILSSGESTVTTPQYYPYGASVSQLSQNPNNRYYTGQRKVTDVDSSLYNYNARYYSPETGVFTQPDTVEGANRFAYVGGNPIMKNDPSGHMSTGSGADGGGKSSEQYIDLSSMSFKSYPNGVSFKDTINSYMPSPESLSGDPYLDLAANSFIGGVEASAAIYGGYRVGLIAATACMGNMPGCQKLLGNSIMEGSGATATGVGPFDDIPLGKVFGKYGIPPTSTDTIEGLYNARNMVDEVGFVHNPNIPAVAEGNTRYYRGVEPDQVSKQFTPPPTEEQIAAFQAYNRKFGYDSLYWAVFSRMPRSVKRVWHSLSAEGFDAAYAPMRGGRDQYFTSDLNIAINEYSSGGVVYYLDMPFRKMLRYTHETTSRSFEDVYRVPQEVILEHPCGVICYGSGLLGGK